METAAGGSYLLLLRLRRAGPLQIGRLGEIDFAAGWYVYCGSALGPGGLRARIARHQRADKRLRWHIDYLRAAADLVGAFAAGGSERLECTLAAGVASLADATPIPGFGASDCRCATHLFGFLRRPALRQLPVGPWRLGGP